MIRPSPLNMRKRFDPAQLESLAGSIRQNGVLQPILLRRVTNGLVFGHDEGDHYAIVLGERRWRAAGMAGLDVLPAIVREDIDDKLHLKLAMEENIQRDDLTVMEKAHGFRAMMDAGWTQEEIGRDFGRGVGSISNTVRLLDLPADVQDLIESGRLSPAHGVALHRYKDFPAVASRLAQAAVEKGWPTKTLEAGLNWEPRGDLVKAGLVVDFSDYRTKPEFDVNAVCAKDCPFGAFRRSGDSNAGICLNPEHFKTLQAEATKERDASKAAEADRLRQDALEKSRQAQEAVRQATTKAGREAAEKDAVRAATAAETLKAGLPTCQSLGYGNYAEINSAPSGCSKDCPCRAKALGYRDRVVEICVDPKRFAALKSRVSRDEQKERRTRFEGFETEIQGRLATDSVDSRALAMLLWWGIRAARKDVRSAVAERLPTGGGFEALKGLLEQAQGTQGEQAWELLSHWPPAVIVNLALEVSLCEEMAQKLDYKDDSVPKTKWFLSAPVGEPVPAESHPEPVSALEEAGGLGDAYECDRCGEYLTAGCFESVNPEFLDAADMADEAYDGPVDGLPVLVRMTSGEVLTIKGMSYCEDCGPTLQVCRMCGCTDERACAGGCSWAAEDLCSACAPKPTEPATVPEGKPSLFPPHETEAAGRATRYASPGPLVVFGGDPESFDGALFTMLTGGVRTAARLRKARAPRRDRFVRDQ